jgi:glyoxylase-like metal-dependent hydrolase (beta-lactamase superfamily II)
MLLQRVGWARERRIGLVSDAAAGLIQATGFGRMLVLTGSLEPLSSPVVCTRGGIVMAESHERARRDHPSHLSRRRFLKTAAGSSAAFALGRGLSAVASQARRRPNPQAGGGTTQLSEHLLVHHGPINMGVVRHGERALLVDCSGADAVRALSELGIAKVEQILFTHHHRDQVCGAYELAAAGAKIAAPVAEQDLFANPAAYWNNDKNVWRLANTFRPHPLTLVDPLRVDQALADGQEISFGPAKIRVLATPGHTDGAVSCLVEADGKRVVFCGDCIYDEGQVWDIYSLQKGFSKGGRSIGGYHGFMGDRWRLVESLGRIKNLQPHVLAPSHGNLMTQPARAIDALVQRFETCYEHYVAISALRHYFPELFADYAGRAGQMPIRPGIKPPDCLRHFGTTWMLVSKSGAALVMDVGSPKIVEQIKQMLAQGEIKSVEGLWVTHYHYDHTDGIPEFQKEFDCPCFTDRRLAEVLTNPTAWRLPCLAPEPIRVHQPMEDGHSWRWREFQLTSYFYPGQTRYHAALLAESEGLRMFFVGDSHTMGGIDDYCAYNRNWLGRDTGFQHCVSLIEKLMPTHIFNCHVADAFTFTREEIGFMRRNLDDRELLFGQLVPWDHPNYAMDASWVRCDPYTQKAKPGEEVRLEAVVNNHSTDPNLARCRVAPPRLLGGKPGPWVEAEVGAKAEGRLPLVLPIPPDARPGRCVAVVDVKYGPWRLPQLAEAIVDIG